MRKRRIAQDMQARRESVNPLLTMLPTAEEIQNRQTGSPVYQRAMRAELPGGEQQNTASTGETVNENGLTALTDRERVNLSSGRRNKIVSTFQDAVSFVRNALSDRQNTDRAYLGKVPETTAQKVLSDTGINITGYNAVIPSGAVRHMFNRHGDANTEAALGQRAVTPEDVARIPNVISDPDRVTLSSKPDANGRTALLFEKDLGDVFVTVQAVSDGTHSIQADTLYIRKKNSQDTVSDNGASAPSPNRNVRNVPSQSSSNRIILPGSHEVNIQTAVPFSMDLPRAVPIEDTSEIYDIYGSGRENLPETAVGANKASPWGEFVASSKEFFPEGANAARDVDVPTTDPQGRRIRKTAATAMGAKAIPDEAIADIQNMVLRGELSYNRVSDKSSIDRAVKTIQDKGYQGALEEFRNSVSKGVVSKDIATLGQQLLVNAANAGDGKTTAELLTLYAQMETTAGQAVQAASILRKLAPNDQLYAAQRIVERVC